MSGDGNAGELRIQIIRSGQPHQLHGVKFLMPALCRIRQGRKVIVRGEYTETVDNTRLILFPAGYDFGIANYPERGGYLSELLSLPPSLIHRFRQHYHPSDEKMSPVLSVNLTRTLTWSWEKIIDAFAQNISAPVLEHIVEGMLLALSEHHVTGLLLPDQKNSVRKKCQEILMVSPDIHWTAGRLAAQVHMAASTLHRHLAVEGTSFKCLLDDVRLGNALSALQTTRESVSEIARKNGYRCPSRFTARFRQRYHITPRELRRAMKIG